MYIVKRIYIKEHVMHAPLSWIVHLRGLLTGLGTWSLGWIWNNEIRTEDLEEVKDDLKLNLLYKRTKAFHNYMHYLSPNSHNTV